MRIDQELNNVLFTGKQWLDRDIGSSPVGTVIADELGGMCFAHQTVFTLVSLPVSVVGATGVGFGGTQIYDFPAGVLWVFACMMNLTFDTTGTNLSATDGGDCSIGTTVAGDGTLSSTDEDLCPETSVDPLSDGATGYLAAGAMFDGSATAKDVYVNMLIDDGDIGDTESLLISGTIIITWVNLGDY